MANNVMIPTGFGAVSKVAQQYAQQVGDDDLAGGISSGFAVVSYRGKVWRIKHRGEERPLMQDDGVSPRGSIEVVIVKANPNLSKIFYKNGFVEGSAEAPDCFSTNGIAPDPSAKDRQATTCAGCPHNAWGSKITPNGKSGKACADSKRLAVVPAGDLNNDVFGGPMLLRVPAASLQDLASFSKQMKGLGYPYFAIATRISFDINEAFPKFVFGAIRPLTDDEAQTVIGLRDDEAVQRILAEAVEMADANAPEQPDLGSVFEQPPAVQEPKPQAAPTTSQRAAAAANPANRVTQPGNAQPAPAAQVQEPEDTEYTEVEEPKPAPKPRATKPKPAPAPAPAPAPVETAPETVETDEDLGGAPDDFDDMLEGLLS